MDETLKSKLNEKEKEHQKYRNRYRLGERLKIYAKRGVRPFADGTVKGWGAIIGRIILVLCLYRFEIGFGQIAAIYLVIHLVAGIVGGHLYKKNSRLLYQLEDECIEMRDDYFINQCSKNGILGGSIDFDDGVSVGSGYLVAPMKKDCGPIHIFQLENSEECKTYYGRHYIPEEFTLSLSDKIASVDFSDKYGITTHESNELQGMKFFAPSLQLKMLKTSAMNKFMNIKIENRRFSAKTQHKVELPTVIKMFERKRVEKYFEEVDVYCQKMCEMADAVHKEFLQIEFILG